MPEARLASGLWVAAYRRRLSMMGIPAFVVARGDDTAGAVLVKLNTLDGNAQVFERRYDLETGQRVWDQITQGPETEVDAQISGQRQHDPDLWLIEVEDRDGRHLLDQDGLA